MDNVTLNNGGQISILGFGVFQTARRKPRPPSKPPSRLAIGNILLALNNDLAAALDFTVAEMRRWSAGLKGW